MLSEVLTLVKGLKFAFPSFVSLLNNLEEEEAKPTAHLITIVFDLQTVCNRMESFSSKTI